MIILEEEMGVLLRIKIRDWKRKLVNITY